MTASAVTERITWRAILGNGLLLPLALLVLYGFALAAASRGKGGYEAAFLAVSALAIVPGLLLANGWLFFLRWRSHWRVFGAGMALPTLFAVLLTQMLYGSREANHWLEGIIKAWPGFLWLGLALFYLPLAALAARAVMRRAS